MRHSFFPRFDGGARSISAFMRVHASPGRRYNRQRSRQASYGPPIALGGLASLGKNAGIVPFQNYSVFQTDSKVALGPGFVVLYYDHDVRSFASTERGRRRNS